MTKKVSYLIMFCCFFVGIAHGQTNFQETILGTWELKRVKTEIVRIQKDSVSTQEQPFLKKDILLSFQPEMQLEMRVAEFSLLADYLLVDNKLTIGKYTYSIQKIDAYKMILRHTTSNDIQTYVYHRISEKE